MSSTFPIADQAESRAALFAHAALHGEMSHVEHAVQFYSDQDFLLDSLARFVGTALGAGDPAVVVATKEHRDGLEARLRARGIEVDLAREQGRYKPLDAAQTLSRFLVDGVPDPRRFESVLTPVVEASARAAGQSCGRVAAFGEMVALLWQDGKRDAALQLERLWNQLIKKHSISLLCAYPMKAFSHEGDSDPLSRVCAEHSAVIPTEAYTNLTNDSDRLRTIAQLQQKAQALDAGIVELEQAKAQTFELRTQNVQLMEEIRLRERITDGLRTLSGRLLMVRDEERRRVAAELHDSIAQLLAALALDMGVLDAEKNVLTPLGAASLSRSTVLVQDLMQQVRGLSHVLHPPTLDQMGLVSALEWYVQAFADRTNIKVTLDVADNLGRLPHELELAIFRVVQEALTNIHRHSGSAVAFVRIHVSDSELDLEIEDRGKGFSASPESNGGLGLSGMRERIRQLGGTVNIRSDAQGTVLSTHFPLTNPCA